MTKQDRLTRALYALHDGEASAWQRFWLRRRLAKDPAARRELGTISEIGTLLRENAAEEATPDLWDGIQAQLPYAESPARNPEEASTPRLVIPRAIGGAVAAAVAVMAVVFFVGTGPVDGPLPGSVEWLDTGERSVMVLQDDAEATIIWVLSDEDGRAGNEAI
jgi:anti-sigma factor RsiW